MKKIIGSPIGLGEVNLTVDNRVRRNIKEYFGNVDNNNSELQEAIREDAKQDQEETDDILGGTVDEMNETACNKAQCKKWDSDAKVCNSALKKCEDTELEEICCVTDDCIGQKRIQFKKNQTTAGIIWIIIFAVVIICCTIFLGIRYYRSFNRDSEEMFKHWPYKTARGIILLSIFGILICILNIVLSDLGIISPSFITCEDEIAKKKCESDVTKKWDSSEKKCVDKCENGKICTGNKCKCECPEGETYRTYGSLGKKKCVENCKIPEKYCKKYGTCVTAGMCV